MEAPDCISAIAKISLRLVKPAAANPPAAAAAVFKNWRREMSILCAASWGLLVLSSLDLLPADIPNSSPGENSEQRFLLFSMFSQAGLTPPGGQRPSAGRYGKYCGDSSSHPRHSSAHLHGLLSYLSGNQPPARCRSAGSGPGHLVSCRLECTTASLDQEQ